MSGKEQQYLEKPPDYKYSKFIILIPLVLYVLEDVLIFVEDNAWRGTIFGYLIFDIVLFILQKQYKNNLSKLTIVVLVGLWGSCLYSIVYLTTVYLLSWYYVVTMLIFTLGFLVWRTKFVMNYSKKNARV